MHFFIVHFLFVFSAHPYVGGTVDTNIVDAVDLLGLVFVMMTAETGDHLPLTRRCFCLLKDSSKLVAVLKSNTMAVYGLMDKNDCRQAKNIV